MGFQPFEPESSGWRGSFAAIPTLVLVLYNHTPFGHTTEFPSASLRDIFKEDALASRRTTPAVKRLAERVADVDCGSGRVVPSRQ